VDILLTHDPQESSIRGRHARLLHNLESNTLIVIADEKMQFHGDSLPVGSVQASTRTKTTAFGYFEYCLQFTNIEPNLYRSLLDQLARTLNFTDQRPGESIDPTPTDTDYPLKDKYIIRGSFASGSSCFVCSAIDKTGANFAVKKIIALTSGARSNAMNEIEMVKKLISGEGNIPTSLPFWSAINQS
jgi:hypothetical protein